MTIGVLAFQGDVIEHERALRALGVEAKEVRSLSDLEEVSALIIPGGESTVIGKFLEETGLRERIIDRHEKEGFPIYGTCAGAILLAKEVFSDGVPEKRYQPLGLMNVSIERNAYGRQTESFEAIISLSSEGEKRKVSVVFIRAPKVKKVGPEITILATHDGSPIVYQQANLLASTFHPELAEGVSLLHRLFLSLCLTPIRPAC